MGDANLADRPHPQPLTSSGESPFDAQKSAINLLTNVFLARVMAAQGSALSSSMDYARTHGPSDLIDLPFLGPGFAVAYFSDQVGWQFPAGRPGAMFMLYAPAGFWLYAEFMNGFPARAIIGADGEHPPLNAPEFQALHADIHHRLGGYLSYYRVPPLLG